MERVLDIGGVRIWSTACGNGPGLLMLNGGPGCDDYLAPVSAMLEPRCEVIRFEPRGCGRSDYDGNYDLATTLDDIDRVRDAHGHDRVILCGHSAGVCHALAYSIDHPDRVRGVIGISGGSVVNDRDWSRAYHENLDKIGESYGGKEFIADPRVNEIGNRTWKEYIKRERLLSDLAGIRVPATFIYGGEDIRPSWPVRQVAALLPAGEYVEIADAPHCIWLTHGEELARLLHSALDRIIAEEPET